jgi:hypothetical protein
MLGFVLQRLNLKQLKNKQQKNLVKFVLALIRTTPALQLFVNALNVSREVFERGNNVEEC